MAYYRYTTRTTPKKWAYFRRFWVKEPRHSETISAKKRYTYIVARVIGSSHARGAADSKKFLSSY